jgi:hypothetical protein
MNFAKFAIAVIAFAAAYKAVDVLFLGKPVDPKKAIAEWTEKIKAELPKPVNENTSLTDVRSEWYDGGIHGGDDKYWRETYKSSVNPNEDSLNQEKEAITASICKSEVHRKVMALGIPIQVRVNIPNSYYSKDFDVSNTLCHAKQF